MSRTVTIYTGVGVATWSKEWAKVRDHFGDDDPRVEWLEKTISPIYKGNSTKVVLQGWAVKNPAEMEGTPDDVKRVGVQFTLIQWNGDSVSQSSFVAVSSNDDFDNVEEFIRFLNNDTIRYNFFDRAQMDLQAIRSCFISSKSTDLSFTLVGGEWKEGASTFGWSKKRKISEQ